MWWSGTGLRLQTKWADMPTLVTGLENLVHWFFDNITIFRQQPVFKSLGWHVSWRGLVFYTTPVYGVAETCASIDSKQIQNGMQNLLPFTSFFLSLHNLWPSYDEHLRWRVLSELSMQTQLFIIPFMPNWIYAHSLTLLFKHCTSSSVTNNWVSGFTISRTSPCNVYNWSAPNHSVSTQSFHIPFTSYDDSKQTQWQAYVRITLTGSIAENVLSDPHLPSHFNSKSLIMSPLLTLQRPSQCYIILVDCTLASLLHSGKLPLSPSSHPKSIVTSMMIHSIYHDGLRSHKLDIDETAIDNGIDLISIWLCSFFANHFFNMLFESLLTCNEEQVSAFHVV